MRNNHKQEEGLAVAQKTERKQISSRKQQTARGWGHSTAVRGPCRCSTAVRGFALFPTHLRGFVRLPIFLATASKVLLSVKIHEFLLKVRQNAF